MTATLWGIVKLQPRKPIARMPRIASPSVSASSRVKSRQSIPKWAKAFSIMYCVGLPATGCPKTATISCKGECDTGGTPAGETGHVKSGGLVPSILIEGTRECNGRPPSVAEESSSLLPFFGCHCWLVQQ